MAATADPERALKRLNSQRQKAVKDIEAVGVKKKASLIRKRDQLDAQIDAANEYERKVHNEAWAWHHDDTQWLGIAKTLKETGAVLINLKRMPRLSPRLRKYFPETRMRRVYVTSVHKNTGGRPWNEPTTYYVDGHATNFEQPNVSLDQATVGYQLPEYIHAAPRTAPIYLITHNGQWTPGAKRESVLPEPYAKWEAEVIALQRPWRQLPYAAEEPEHKKLKDIVDGIHKLPEVIDAAAVQYRADLVAYAAAAAEAVADDAE